MSLFKCNLFLNLQIVTLVRVKAHTLSHTLEFLQIESTRKCLLALFQAGKKKFCYLAPFLLEFHNHSASGPDMTLATEREVVLGLENLTHWKKCFGERLKHKN